MRIPPRPPAAAARRPPKAGTILVLLALTASLARAEDQATATTLAQFTAICAAVKAGGGSCGGKGRHEASNTPAMSSELPAAPKLDEPAARLPARPLDGWGRPVRVTIEGQQGVKLESAGPDGELGTPDDLAQRCPGN